MMKQVNDLTGMRFGRLEVLRESTLKGKHKMWLCLCECGNTTEVLGLNLKRGNTKSCGCLRKELGREIGKRSTHGLSGTRLFEIWHGMKQRCHNKNSANYKHYGARGIKVCDEWKSDFKAFYEWAMANGYSDELSIDRIDVNKGYQPNNCRWVNNKTQCNNKRSNRLISFDGETMTVTQWAERYGVPVETLRSRLRRSKTIEEVFANLVIRKDECNA